MWVSPPLRAEAARWPWRNASLFDAVRCRHRRSPEPITCSVFCDLVECFHHQPGSPLCVLPNPRSFYFSLFRPRPAATFPIRHPASALFFLSNARHFNPPRHPHPSPHPIDGLHLSADPLRGQQTLPGHHQSRPPAMSGRYERVRISASIAFPTDHSGRLTASQVNAHDADEPETPTAPLPRPTHPIPNSPPPSFRSRASSRERAGAVNDDLADAFDADGDDSDDEADDRQRLVRGNSTPSFSEATPATAATTPPAGQSAPQQRPVGAAPTTSRVYGSGIQADGVFSNLSAKPERGDGEKDELPPVSHYAPCSSTFGSVLSNPGNPCSHTNKQQPTRRRPTGKPRSSPLASAAPTTSSSMACPWAPSSASSGTLWSRWASRSSASS